MKIEEINKLPNSVKSDLHEFLENKETYQNMVMELKDYDIILEVSGYQFQIASTEELYQLKEFVFNMETCCQAI